MKSFSRLTFKSANEIKFGNAEHSIKCGFDLFIGDGCVLPEVNYTLSPMSINSNNIEIILEQYKEIVRSVLSRSVILEVPGILLEFEHISEMTNIVDIGLKITEQTKKLMSDFYENDGLKSALRVTVCDIKGEERLPRTCTGESVDKIFKAFRENAKAGADLVVPKRIFRVYLNIFINPIEKYCNKLKILMIFQNFGYVRWENYFL